MCSSALLPQIDCNAQTLKGYSMLLGWGISCKLKGKYLLVFIGCYPELSACMISAFPWQPLLLLRISWPSSYLGSWAGAAMGGGREKLCYVGLVLFPLHSECHQAAFQINSLSISVFVCSF